MGLFTTSQLAQNLDSRNEVYKFNGYFRSAHGRLTYLAFLVFKMYDIQISNF